MVQISLLTLVVWCVTVKYFFTRHYVTPLGNAWGVADDVYISASFARTLAHGGGPVWYEGAPRVEGFSSPLWVLALSVLQLNPAFSEDALGLHVLAVNLPIALGLCLAMWIVVSPRDENHRPRVPSWGTWSVLLVLVLSCISLHHWSAGGFETGLTALFPLIGFALVGGALLLAHGGTLLYSTWLGGDFSWERFGYDRFTGTSSLFLACALTRLVSEFSTNKTARTFAATGAALSMALPIFTYVSFWGFWEWRQPIDFRAFLELKRGLDQNDLMSASFVFWGKGIEQVTKPGAVVATCAAGAVPYFSKRKAIDLLGKVDKHVARTTVPASAPPEFRCWRPWPGAGHNKEDLEHSFAERPDVSTVEPPAHYGDHYEKLSHAGLTMWVRRDSELVVIPDAKR